MIVFTGNTTKEYGLTPSGLFFENIRTGNKTGLMRITPDPERFLRWMIQDDVDADIEERQTNTLIKILKGWWERKDQINIRGTFNGELYKRIIHIKKQTT